jgi:hypothetical protein
MQTVRRVSRRGSAIGGGHGVEGARAITFQRYPVLIKLLSSDPKRNRHPSTHQTKDRRRAQMK